MAFPVELKAMRDTWYTKCDKCGDVMYKFPCKLIKIIYNESSIPRYEWSTPEPAGHPSAPLHGHTSQRDQRLSGPEIFPEKGFIIRIGKTYANYSENCPAKGCFSLPKPISGFLPKSGSNFLRFLPKMRSPSHATQHTKWHYHVFVCWLNCR